MALSTMALNLVTPRELRVPLDGAASTTAIIYPAAQPALHHRAALVLAHGAGAGQQSAFMVNFAGGLAGLGLDVITFNFPYAEITAGAFAPRTPRRRIPDRGPV